MLRTVILCLVSMALAGCLATKAVTTTVGVATKATVLTVKTTSKAATGAVDLVTPDGEEEETGTNETDD